MREYYAPIERIHTLKIYLDVPNSIEKEQIIKRIMLGSSPSPNFVNLQEEEVGPYNKVKIRGIFDSRASEKKTTEIGSLSISLDQPLSDIRKAIDKYIVRSDLFELPQRLRKQGKETVRKYVSFWRRLFL